MARCLVVCIQDVWLVLYPLTQAVDISLFGCRMEGPLVYVCRVVTIHKHQVKFGHCMQGGLVSARTRHDCRVAWFLHALGIVCRVDWFLHALGVTAGWTGSCTH